MPGLRVHWRMAEGGGSGVHPLAEATGAKPNSLPDVEAQARFCRLAEGCGIDSVLINFGFFEPDPFLVAAAVGDRTERMRFMVAYRSGLMSPTTFVQQANTLSALIDGRLSFNIVAGTSPAEQRMYGDFLDHDERFARTGEFLAVCRALWRRDAPVDFAGRYYQIQQGWIETPFVSPDRTSPELYISGGSELAQGLAAAQGTCWLTMASAPEGLRSAAERVTAAGKEAGIRGTVICRPTRREALDVAHEMVRASPPAQERRYAKDGSDSILVRAAAELARDGPAWLTPYLWTGLVAQFGLAAIALIGSPDEIAEALLDYRRVGITQFILDGIPKEAELTYFGGEVMPRLRAREFADR